MMVMKSNMIIEEKVLWNKNENEKHIMRKKKQNWS